MYRYHLKRLMDIFIAVLAMPLAIMIMLLLALIIYAEDGGTVFYISDRVGYGGKRFGMIKLRSMKMHAPDIRNDDGSTYNAINDNRLTRIGGFLRKTSLDELPQLINVLLGQMSIVGPRPNLFESPYESLSMIEKKRVTVRPGITGYNQAYYRNAIPLSQRYRNDCYYIEHINFILDLKIILHTFGVVLMRKNIHTEITNCEINEIKRRCGMDE